MTRKRLEVFTLLIRGLGEGPTSHEDDKGLPFRIPGEQGWCRIHSRWGSQELEGVEFVQWKFRHF